MYRPQRHGGGGGGGRVRRDPRRPDFIGAGFAAVISAATFLIHGTVGGDTSAVAGGDQWQVILAFAFMAAGSLSIMHGMRLRDGGARPPAFVQRAADAAAVLLGNVGGPERLLILILCPFLEAWFDFF